MAKLYNLARVSTSTTGTGTITLGSNVSGYLTFANAGVANGDVVTYGIKDGANSEVGYGAYTAAGTTLTRGPIKSTNSNNAISLSGSAEVYVTAMSADFPYPDNYLSGLTLSNDVGSPTTTIDIVPGAAADSTNTEIMRLTATIQKNTTGTWVVGSGAGLDAGSVAANTWYHFWLIRRADTGVVDVLISTNASAPTMPTNYAQKRRIGSMKTNGSSQWNTFIQDGDTFQWLTIVQDIAATNPGTSAVTRTMTTPLGVRVEGIFAVSGINTTTTIAFYLSDLSVNDEVPSAIGPITSIEAVGSVTQLGVGNQRVFTNTSSQIRSRAAASAADLTLYISTKGWVDRRGRDG